MTTADLRPAPLETPVSGDRPDHHAGEAGQARPGGTTLPPPAEGAEEPRRHTGTLRATDLFAILGAALAGLALTAVLFTQLLPFDGTLGFFVVWYASFLGIYALLVSFDEDGPAVRDKVAAVAIHGIAAVMLVALVFVIIYAITQGAEPLGYLNFYIEDMTLAGPLDPLSVGGVLHGIVGTLIMISIALAITIPLGLVCAVFLNEITGTFSRLVRTVVEAMTALPSIVAGLFIYATWILTFGFDQSGLAAGLAITVMMLPIVIRAADVVLRLVPGTLKEASYALGSGQWRTVWHVTLPTARSGLTTSIILGTARGIGETSPVLLTAGFTAAVNWNPVEGSMVSLPLLVFEMVKSPEPTMIARGFGAAAVLMILVLVLFVLARTLGGRGPGELTRRQEHRRVKASLGDSERFDRRDLRRGGMGGPVVPGFDDDHLDSDPSLSDPNHSDRSPTRPDSETETDR